MTDYRDGYWHRWNGGECPVNPKDKVEVILGRNKNYIYSPCEAERLRWSCIEESDIKSFRVVGKSPPPKPREFWVNEYTNGRVGMAHPSYEAASACYADAGLVKKCTPIKRCIHLREVVGGEISKN